jgi:hypothetical protein
MNKVKVRCWKIRVYPDKIEGPHDLYVTYPEDNSGHDLITCGNCGTIYAVTIAKELYIGPALQEKIRGLNCSNCGKPLESSYCYYPETYVINGTRFSFNRPSEIPPDEESIVIELEGIYE